MRGGGPGISRAQPRMVHGDGKHRSPRALCICRPPPVLPVGRLTESRSPPTRQVQVQPLLYRQGSRVSERQASCCLRTLWGLQHRTEALLSRPQGPSQTPAGSTSSSQPATTGTCSCSPPAAGCTRGRTTGRPFWTASGPAELDCALGFSPGPLTSELSAQGLGGGRASALALGGSLSRGPGNTACLPALPSPARP